MRRPTCWWRICSSPAARASSIGSVAQPVANGVTATVMFVNQPIDVGFDADQFGTSLIGFGQVSICGQQKTAFVRLSAEPHAGDDTLILSAAESGWQVGDRLIIPDSRQLIDTETGANWQDNTDEAVISGIADGGLTIALQAPLAWNHPGAYDPRGNLRFLPHVADLTRNVVLCSQDPAGTRGHAIFISQADIDIRYCEFAGMGRTTNSPLDSTTRDSGGNVTHVGTNQIGRYPLHLHYCNGEAGGSPTGYQFRVVGNSIDNGSTAFLPAWGAKWGIDVHHSHYGLIQGNIVYDSVGAGITTEDGSESHNLFDGNFVCKVPGTTSRADLGLEGSGLWFRGVNNSCTNNVIAGLGNQSLGALVYNQEYLQQLPMPAAPGSPPSIATDFTTLPIPAFSNNEIYGCEEGLAYFWVDYGWNGYNPLQVSDIDRFSVWNMNSMGVFAYQSNGFHFNQFTCIEDATALTKQLWGPAGIGYSDYPTANFAMSNSDIEGCYQGIVLPTNTGTPLTYANSYFWNSIDVLWQTEWSVDADARGIGPRQVLFDTDTFETAELPGQSAPPVAIDAYYYVDGGNNVVQSDRLLLKNYHGAGNDYQVFYNQQAASFIIPQTQLYSGTIDPLILACPVAGMTNQQSWSTYGLAVAGAVMPAGAAALPGISGGMAAPFSFADSFPTISVSGPGSATLPSTIDAVATATTSSGAPASYQWFLAYGSGNATFASPASDETSVSFSAPGLYALRCRASDGTLASSADLLVTVADGVGGVQPPTISALTDQTAAPGASTSPLIVTVSDASVPLTGLTVTGTSSDASVLPDSGIVIAGGNGTYGVTFTIPAGASGSTVITLTVSDGTLTASTSFTLTIAQAGSTSTSGPMTTGPTTGTGGSPTAAGSGTVGSAPTAGSATGAASASGGSSHGCGLGTGGAVLLALSLLGSACGRRRQARPWRPPARPAP